MEESLSEKPEIQMWVAQKDHGDLISVGPVILLFSSLSGRVWVTLMQGMGCSSIPHNQP